MDSIWTGVQSNFCKSVAFNIKMFSFGEFMPRFLLVLVTFDMDEFDWKRECFRCCKDGVLDVVVRLKTQCGRCDYLFLQACYPGYDTFVIAVDITLLDLDIGLVTINSPTSPVTGSPDSSQASREAPRQRH